MAAPENLTTASQITTSIREVDFVTQFQKNWDALRTILGIMRPIRKAPGTKLVSYKATVDGGLQGGTAVGEGEDIPLTKTKVEPVAYDDIELGKWAKAVSIEAVTKYGATVAVERTDTAFRNELQKKVLTDFYTFLKTGKLVGTQKTWQRALAIAKGAVLKRFANDNLDVTEVVGFANIMDFYDYLGDKEITVQTEFGLNYVKNFLGYSTLFLLPDAYIEQKKVIAIPVENIDLYYVDPADRDYATMGANYTVSGETNLLGYHAGFWRGFALICRAGDLESLPVAYPLDVVRESQRHTGVDQQRVGRCRVGLLCYLSFHGGVVALHGLKLGAVLPAGNKAAHAVRLIAAGLKTVFLGKALHHGGCSERVDHVTSSSTD